MANKSDPKRKSDAPDPNFVAATPTRVLSATCGGTTISRRLYGDVSPERLVEEQRSLQHRAEQLDPVPKRSERVRVFEPRAAR